MSRRAWLLAALLCVVALAACGGESDDEGTPTTQPASATTSAPAASPAEEALLRSIPPVERLGAPSPPGTFVGRVSGTEALIAIVRNDAGDAAAYVCDGRQIGTWLSGRRGPAGLELSNRARTVSLRATEEAGEIKGSVRLEDGSTRDFSARPAAQGEKGLYRTAGVAAGGPYQVGWILFEGEIRGSRADRPGTPPRQGVSDSRADTQPSTGRTTAPPPPTRGKPEEVCVDLREEIALLTPAIENIKQELSRATDQGVRDDLQSLLDQSNDLLERLRLEAESLACR